MKYLFAILIIALMFLGGCKTKNTDSDAEIESIENGLNKAVPGKAKTWVVILPGLGCNGCIQEGEAFMRDYVDSANVLFILTKVQSVKILQLKIGKTIVDRANVFIDHDGVFNIQTKNVVYPCIAQLKDGNIVAHQFQSPSNSQAFEWLRTQLD
ncbi:MULTISPECIES: hypothetical protein [Niastella]|uniref:HMA domain-containing protein n=1 Tax=Niastella soli TaxID=2821487 RepID=A0ABS3Z165_9BACT|nr:hypothetical protein [Niastella soli]MBO9203844.1 hypothetical protein [Niastella soli]